MKQIKKLNQKNKLKIYNKFQFKKKKVKNKSKLYNKI